jgi:hypothetical protein
MEDMNIRLMLADHEQISRRIPEEILNKQRAIVNRLADSLYERQRVACKQA